MTLLVRYVLAFGYLLLVIQPSIPLAQYLIQKKYFAEKLCVNKSNPKLGCKGKCALKKQLILAEKKNREELPFTDPELEYNNLPPHIREYITIHISLLTETVLYKIPLGTKLSPGFKQILHPPPRA